MSVERHPGCHDLEDAITYKKDKDAISGYESQSNSHMSVLAADQGVALVIRRFTLRWEQITGYCTVQHSVNVSLRYSE